MAKRRRLPLWWRYVILVFLGGVVFVGYVAANWDKLEALAEGPDEPDEIHASDLLPCGIGTHQEGSKCVSNPVSAKAPEAPAPAPK